LPNSLSKEEKKVKVGGVVRPQSEQSLLEVEIAENKKEATKPKQLSTFVKPLQRSESPDPKRETRKKNNKENYNIINLLGEGAYSKVVLVEEIITGFNYAMKVIEKAFLKKVI